jgi:hypothetical protein
MRKAADFQVGGFSHKHYLVGMPDFLGQGRTNSLRGLDGADCQVRTLSPSEIVEIATQRFSYQI